jgi:hypothetical protein
MGICEFETPDVVRDELTSYGKNDLMSGIEKINEIYLCAVRNTG